MRRSDERMDAIAERIGSALADEDVLESAVVLGDMLANMIAGLTPQPAKRQQLVELFVNRELKQGVH
jgi:hypothetical protein